jgi:uncharacterized protein (TIGR03437 family)
VLSASIGYPEDSETRPPAEPMRHLHHVLFITLAVSQVSPAQVCRLSVAGLNQSRRVTGQIHAECPEEIVHTAPFGNWGVTSTFGQKGDSHQFDGWCHNTRICDNAGTCKTDCVDGWYEWNSCTDNSLYTAPNCTLYNSADCTEQTTATGINVHGTKYVEIPVRCPIDSNGDGIPDQGGCADVKQYSSGTNFMSLYELDPICCDELVQTVYFPDITVPLSCDAFGCAQSGSDFVSPSFWDSPATPAKVFAQVAMLVNWGGFVNQNNACRISVPTFSAVSAASFTGPNLAADSIGTALGQDLVPITAQPAGRNPPTSVSGFSVEVADSSGTKRSAGLFYISPTQVNFLVPAGTAAGAATLSILNGDVVRTTAKIQIDPVAPALFTENQSGKGVPAALVFRIAADGSTSYAPVYDCPSAGQCVPAPIDLGSASDEVYLILFGTGIRHRSTTTAVSVAIGSTNLRVDYAGAQNQYAGLDQVNVLLPHELAGRGMVDLVLTVDSKPANTVQIAFR